MAHAGQPSPEAEVVVGRPLVEPDKSLRNIVRGADMVSLAVEILGSDTLRLRSICSLLAITTGLVGNARRRDLPGPIGAFVHHTGIAGSGFKSLEEGESVSYEVTQGRKGMQATNVSRGSTDGADKRGTEDSLRVPLEVEGAARILAEHFDPGDLYWAMVEAERQRGN